MKSQDRDHSTLIFHHYRGTTQKVKGPLNLDVMCTKLQVINPVVQIKVASQPTDKDAYLDLNRATSLADYD